MRQLHALGVTRRGVAVQNKILALVDLGGAVGEGAEAELWSLQIDQDADRPVVIGLDGADRGHQLAHLVVIGMAHIDAKHVGAGFEQPADHGAVRRCRPQRGHDFGPPLPPHGVLFPGAGADVAPAPAGGALS